MVIVAETSQLNLSQVSKTRSTTAVDPCQLKLKEKDISLTKNYYCITISIQEISSVQKFVLKIQQIFRPWPVSTTPTH